MPTLQTKIKRTERRIADLQKHLQELRNQKNGNFIKSHPEVLTSHLPEGAITITFDGGTTCNRPKEGFGMGYGSYQIEGRPVVSRIKFGIGHSCNSAEIRTLESALADLAGSHPDPASLHLVIKGDSKIALKWANPKYKEQPAAHTWHEFHKAIAMLRVQLPKFASITRIWHGRDHSVKLFGH